MQQIGVGEGDGEGEFTPLEAHRADYGRITGVAIPYRDAKCEKMANFWKIDIFF